MSDEEKPTTIPLKYLEIGYNPPFLEYVECKQVNLTIRGSLNRSVARLMKELRKAEKDGKKLPSEMKDCSACLIKSKRRHTTLDFRFGEEDEDMIYAFRLNKSARHKHMRFKSPQILEYDLHLPKDVETIQDSGGGEYFAWFRFNYSQFKEEVWDLLADGHKKHLVTFPFQFNWFDTDLGASPLVLQTPDDYDSKTKDKASKTGSEKPNDQSPAGILVHDGAHPPRGAGGAGGRGG